jgi:hypothetical protein
MRQAGVVAEGAYQEQVVSVLRSTGLLPEVGEEGEEGEEVSSYEGSGEYDQEGEDEDEIDPSVFAAAARGAAATSEK